MHRRQSEVRRNAARAPPRRRGASHRRRRTARRRPRRPATPPPISQRAMDPPAAAARRRSRPVRAPARRNKGASAGPGVKGGGGGDARGRAAARCSRGGSAGRRCRGCRRSCTAFGVLRAHVRGPGRPGSAWGFCPRGTAGDAAVGAQRRVRRAGDGGGAVAWSVRRHGGRPPRRATWRRWRRCTTCRRPSAGIGDVAGREPLTQLCEATRLLGMDRSGILLLDARGERLECSALPPATCRPARRGSTLADLPACGHCLGAGR